MPAPLRWVIERLLAKEPAERYDSTRDLYRELKQIRERRLKRPVHKLRRPPFPRPSESAGWFLARLRSPASRPVRR